MFKNHFHNKIDYEIEKRKRGKISIFSVHVCLELKHHGPFCNVGLSVEILKIFLFDNTFIGKL